MSKGYSGLFAGTIGSAKKRIYSTNFIIENDDTSVVWKHINATDDSYPGTNLPVSFVVDVPISKITPDGKMWTHGNASEHMYTAIASVSENPIIKNSNPMLYTQFILYDYYKSLSIAIKRGVGYEEKISINNWEFVFAKPRNTNQYPVVKHAMFLGIS